MERERDRERQTEMEIEKETDRQTENIHAYGNSKFFHKYQKLSLKLEMRADRGLLNLEFLFKVY
jgi:hypothetical protein